ncbi:T9SS type B sorting domain-containing protein [Thalassobellus suaedae]|uniref:T9SS type B sorting domain-containing protein n=1 Tax=Thalassobellus suaedae TaxID=3074124 RepID=A0ABY9XRX7_9FLAO|nr:T9SS type B sorting domain-containing protein [Flavobacteriaceae bacterium HL-DH14]
MAIKKIKFLIILSLICFVGAAQTTTIPDPNFEQALIDKGLDVAPIDGLVLTSNINANANLDVTGYNISDLTGIEGFTSLSILNCSNNQLSTLNISQNTQLTQLFFSNNQISNLDITIHTNLEVIWGFNNQLSTLNTSQNTNLRALRCENNNLTSLDISKNIALVDLVCENNQLTSIDISNNNVLSTFQCGNNLLSNLDVSLNTNLSTLSCEQNLLSLLDVSNNSRLNTLICFSNQLTVLDLTKNESLTSLNCSNNQLCDLNVNNGNNNNVVLMNFNLNPDLNCVVVDNVNEDHNSWQPVSFSNYVNTPNACSNFVLVDVLDDYIGPSYTLPILTNGNYFTAPGGHGTPLNSGDIISTSQTIYIYNETVCHNNESNFNVLINNGDYYIPKYFTPNNDGSHDLWKVIDNHNSINNITIYNRHGKLLKFLLPNASGWDGTYNGALLTSDSYWYIIVLNTGKTVKGYFTLKR